MGSSAMYLHAVPVWLNQWAPIYGIGANGGRYDFVRELAATLQQLDIGWAWWTWRGGGDAGWKHGSMEIVYDYANGTVGMDQPAVDALAPHMSVHDRRRAAPGM